MGPQAIPLLAATLALCLLGPGASAAQLSGNARVRAVEVSADGTLIHGQIARSSLVRKSPEALVSTDPTEAPLAVAGGAVPPAVPQLAAYSDPWVAFHFFDANGDGYIVAMELAMSMMEEAEAGDVKGEKNNHPFSPAELDRMVADIDTNQDKQVSYKEFEDHWLAEREGEITAEGAEAAKLKAVLDSASGAASEPATSDAVGPEALALPGLIEVSEEARLRRARAEEAGDATWWWQPSPPPPPPPVRDPNAGTVAAVYTFGAPGTAKSPLKNFLRWDGCFPGARVFTSSRVPGWGWGFYYKSDPVSWLATHNHIWGLNRFRHAMMNVLELKDWALGYPSLHSCGDHSTWWPERDYYYSVSLHKLSPGAYQTGLRSQQHYPQPRTLLAHAALAYETGDAVHTKAAATARVMVASVVHALDAVYLLQDPSNKECTVTFKGSDSPLNDLGDWVNNVAKALPVKFCGFNGVHKGFKEELFGLIQHAQWQNLRSKLPKCAAVVATGHSLGGAMAELFAACANRAPGPGQDGYSDYQLIAWTRGTPEVIGS